MIKKFLCTITAVALITCFFAGCDKSNSEHTQGQVDTTDGEHTHEWVDATCEHPKTCSICDTTEGNALPHEYLNGTCTVCGSDNPQFLADYKQAITECLYKGTKRNIESEENSKNVEVE